MNKQNEGTEGSEEATAPPRQITPFERAPHRTLLGLSVPVLLSLVAEPLTGLVDTAFIARLGAVPLAALGVATMLLSSAFWIFNFLGIGTQTEVARSLGAKDRAAAQRAWGVALWLAIGFGFLVLLLGQLFLGPLVALLGAHGEMAEVASVYLRIRLLGAPFLLATTVAFGALRGLQEMRLPMWIALAINAANILLDAVLILGWGPFPALGIAGAAWATTASQAVGGGWAVWIALRRLGHPLPGGLKAAMRLLVVGRDLFLRTGFLILFLAFATRTATEIGAASGAAHQAIRQVWLLSALALDALAVTAQSLAGAYLGSGRIHWARKVAAVAGGWGLAVGAVLGGSMLLVTEWTAWALVPPDARTTFFTAWWIAALTQPLNALTFVTDGIHWAARDYAFLRNAVIAATSVGVAALLLLPFEPSTGLAKVWAVTGLWITVRSLFGILRVWPGLGGPLSAASKPPTHAVDWR